MSNYSITEQLLPKTRQAAFAFALSHGLIPSPPHCRTKCKGHADGPPDVFSHYYRTETDMGVNRCPKSNKCKIDETVAKNTWFENSRLSPEIEFRVLFGFAHNDSYDRMIVGCKNEKGEVISSATLAARMTYCREMVNSAFLLREQTLPKIGGPNVIVQIDESKFGKRKYNRGRIVEGHWVLGMIADGSEDLRLVICPDNRRDSNTLTDIIKMHVETGSIIHTYEWRAYRDLAKNGYIHQTVNHSQRFVSEDGTHTQRIESQWKAAKTYFKGKHIPEDKFADYLCDYLWRRHCKKNNLDPMEELLRSIRIEYGDFRK